MFNSSFHYWGGGWSTGPRYITPSLGFACFPLAFMWIKAGSRTRALMLTILGLSFILSMICANVDMTVSSEFSHPLFQTLIPHFLSGDVNNLGRLFLPGDVNNPGRLSGVPGYLSLLPLIVVWTIAGWRIVQLLPRRDAFS